MLDKDFYWCYNHESLYRWWLNCICIIHKSHVDESLDSDSIFSLWQKAKEWAYKIANSRNPELSYINMFREIFYNTHDHRFYLFFFIHTMLMSIKNENLEEMVSNLNKTLFEMISSLELDENSSDIESDYDYSLPDGGIKDETITETGTKAITETDGSVTLPDVLDTNEFKKYLSLAKEKGLIKDVNGKLEWIQIGNRGGDSQLAYFLGRAFGYIHSENGNNGKEFPGDELDELFGVTRIYRLLVQVHRALRPQKWRRKIDELFE